MLKTFMILAYLMSHPQGSPHDPEAFRLSSPALKKPFNSIPKNYTCHGKNISIPLAWSGTPAGAQSLALIMLDEDVPRNHWYHWALFNISPSQSALPENTSLTHGMKAAANSWSHFSYDGPCPPSGKHHYIIRLYALDIKLPSKEKLSTLQLREAMRGHIIATSTLRTRSHAPRKAKAAVTRHT